MSDVVKYRRFKHERKKDDRGLGTAATKCASGSHCVTHASTCLAPKPRIQPFSPISIARVTKRKGDFGQQGNLCTGMLTI